MDSSTQWAHLNPAELRRAGEGLVTGRLERLGCTVKPDPDSRRARLTVLGRTTRTRVAISTQRVGGYSFWTKRSLHPALDLYAVVVLIRQHERPGLFVVPSTDWLAPEPPLTSRDYENSASEPEFGIELAAAKVALLDRYRWSAEKDAMFVQ